MDTIEAKQAHALVIIHGRSRYTYVFSVEQDHARAGAGVSVIARRRLFADSTIRARVARALVDISLTVLAHPPWITNAAVRVDRGM
jgi:hypothetical protein